MDFDDKELVIPLVNITLSTYDKYLKQFTGTFNMENFAVKIANDFYQNPYPNIHYITEMLKIGATEYWTKRNNTKLIFLINLLIEVLIFLLVKELVISS